MAETITMPKLGFDMQEGTLVRWVRAEGESINKGDILAEIETDKATVEVESSAGGFVRKLLVDQGAIVPIGAPIAIIGGKDEKIEIPRQEPALVPPVNLQEQKPIPAAVQVQRAAAEVQQLAPAAGPRRASPLARRMAGEAHVDLGRLHGSGPGGRIIRRDVEAALSAGAGGVAAASSPKFGSLVAGVRNDEIIATSKLRQAIGRRMAEAKATIPHFYVTHEYDVGSLLDLREQANAVLAQEEKLSVNDFVVRAVALTLRDFPNLNAAFQGDRVLRHGSINIGVAVAVDGGLLTVVCQNADQKSVRHISEELKAMAGRARTGKVHPDDIDGSTFTVSNLGMYEVENFAAIINPPEVAILAVGSARQQAVVENDQIRAGSRMKATIAVDHRVSDGAEAAQFMQSLARYIETPLSLFL